MISPATPRKVFIVRWASGVTTTRQWPVPAPEPPGGVTNSTPVARMSWVKTSPSWSPATLPTKPARPPSDATPVAVLAADPPDTSMAGPMSAYRADDSSASISACVPFTRSWRTT